MKASDSTRGIVHAASGQDKFSLSRMEPGRMLKPFVEHYWIVRYQLPPGQSFTQTVLSFPSIHLAFEDDMEGRRGLLYGIPKRPFVRQLQGEGRVLGIKFLAGGFYPFWQKEVSSLTGTTISAAEAFDADMVHWMNEILDAGDDAQMAKQAEQALLERLPERDAQAELAVQIVEQAMNDRDLIKVEQLCERCGLSIRQLQRLFHKYVGVTPKWVIKRFRLQEAAERLEKDKSAHWAELAIQLGYFDQAHFIKDFKSVLGQSPAAYRSESRGFK